MVDSRNAKGPGRADRERANRLRVWLIQMETEAGEIVQIPVTWADTGSRGISGIRKIVEEYGIDFKDVYEWG